MNNRDSIAVGDTVIVYPHHVRFGALPVVGVVTKASKRLLTVKFTPRDIRSGEGVEQETVVLRSSGKQREGFDPGVDEVVPFDATRLRRALDNAVYAQCVTSTRTLLSMIDELKLSIGTPSEATAVLLAVVNAAETLLPYAVGDAAVKLREHNASCRLLLTAAKGLTK